MVAKDKNLLSRIFGLSLHYYCWTAGKGQSLDFTVDDWYQLLWQSDLMDSLLTKQWLAMGEFDAGHKVKMVVDEWGAWHRGKALDPRYLFSYVPSLRDAFVTGITLDIFNRHADKLAMCNVAQLVNCIHSPLSPSRTISPQPPSFMLIQSHKGGQSLRFVSDAPSISFGAGKSFWGLAGSASLHGKTLVITVVNPHVSEPRTAEVSLRGACSSAPCHQG